MAPFFLKRSPTYFLTLLSLALLVTWTSCKKKTKIYNSRCDTETTFKKVSFTKLIDSIEKFDQQFIEVSGTYKSAKEQSALFNDSLFVDHSNRHALWINFTQDCPLYLSGTTIGFFEATDGDFLTINNRKIVLHGKVNVHNTGHSKQYRGSIDRVSFIEL